MSHNEYRYFYLVQFSALRVKISCRYDGDECLNGQAAGEWRGHGEGDGGFGKGNRQLGLGGAR